MFKTKVKIRGGEMSDFDKTHEKLVKKIVKKQPKLTEDEAVVILAFILGEILLAELERQNVDY